MKWRKFVRDRAFLYISCTAAYVLMLLFLAAFRIRIELLIMLSLVFWLLVVTLEAWEFLRKRRFYEDLLAGMDGLDHKYLISEMLGNPSFYEGQIICSLLHESGKSMYEYVAGYRRDISDFREFIEMWVHEIKLPVSSLLLMLHNRQSESDRKILEQLRRIDGYVDTVLYYARSENAEKDYLIKETGLKAVVSDVVMKNREDLLLHNVRVKAEKLDVSVLTDGKWLSYILGQLMANSIKYLEEQREAVICIFAEEYDDKTVLHVRDNGIGIPESDLPYIFEKCFTGENGRVRAKSTGMGLFIVKNLCGRLGHGIEAHSVRGEYTEFEISFFKNDFYKF